MLISFLNILEFQKFKHSTIGTVRPRVMCWVYIPLFQTPWWWHPGVKKCRSWILVMNCILLSEFVGCCINCKNMHDMSNIKFVCLCSAMGGNYWYEKHASISVKFDKQLNLLPIQLITKFDCYFSIMSFFVWVTMKIALLIKDHNVEFEKYFCKLFIFSDLKYSSSILNILLINFNSILELLHYLEKHWREMCKHRLQQFKTKGSRHFCHANQPIWLISIYQLHQVLEIKIMLFYTYM